VLSIWNTCCLSYSQTTSLHAAQRSLDLLELGNGGFNEVGSVNSKSLREGSSGTGSVLADSSGLEDLLGASSLSRSDLVRKSDLGVLAGLGDDNIRNLAVRETREFAAVESGHITGLR
jgi:hypothetical protein